MSVFNGLSEAIASMGSLAFLLAFLIGCLNGMLTGLLPGLGGSVGIALMIPFTYGMDTMSAVGMFVAALGGQTFCGSITAILLNVPGSSPSAATTLDGFPLAKQGRGGFAIGVSATASFLGCMIGTVAVIALIPVVRPLVLLFSFPEFMMMGILGLLIIAMASRGSLIKGIISGLTGVLLSFVGFAPIGGDVRYAFDQPALYSGFDVVIVLVGMFSLTEALGLLKTNQSIAKDSPQRFGHRQVWEGMAYTFKQPWLVLRSSLIGTGIGFVPAVGGTVAAFLAYFQATKTVRKNPQFGKGDPRGVIAPEASGLAKDSASSLPSLAFGIPGSSDWAVVMGALILHGVQPGPNLIKESPDIIWLAILSVTAASIFASAVGLLSAPQLLKITRVKAGILSPIVLMLAAVGAYALNLSVTDVVISIGFGLIAYAMRAVNMPLIPLILGFILGPLVERSYLQTQSTFGSVWSGIVTRPIALVLFIIVIGVVVYEVIASRRNKEKDPQAVASGVKLAVRWQSLTLMAAFGIVAAVALVMSTSFSQQGRTFPIITTVVMIVLIAAYLTVALVPALRTRFPGFISDGGGMEGLTEQLESEAAEIIEETGGPARTPDVAPAGGAQPSGERSAVAVAVREDEEVLGAQVPAEEPEETSPEERRRMARRLRLSLVLVVALVVLTILFGFAVSLPVITFLFLKVVTRESWRTSIITTVATSVVFYVLFVTLLKVPLDGGMFLPIG